MTEAPEGTQKPAQACLSHLPADASRCPAWATLTTESQLCQASVPPRVWRVVRLNAGTALAEAFIPPAGMGMQAPRGQGPAWAALPTVEGPKECEGRMTVNAFNAQRENSPRAQLPTAPHLARADGESPAKCALVKPQMASC